MSCLRSMMEWTPELQASTHWRNQIDDSSSPDQSGYTRTSSSTPGLNFTMRSTKRSGILRGSYTHNFFELFVIAKGEVLHTVNGRTHLLSEGTLMFIRPAEVHYYEPSEGKECHLINLAFRETTA